MQKSAAGNCGCPQLLSIAAIAHLGATGSGLTGLRLIPECPFWIKIGQFINL